MQPSSLLLQAQCVELANKVAGLLRSKLQGLDEGAKQMALLTQMLPLWSKPCA